MLRRVLTILGASVAASGITAAAASAATQGFPLPKAANGKPVTLVAGGLTTPTAFAFGGGTMFEADGGNVPQSPGGVYSVNVHKGTTAKLAHSPAFVAGIAWHKNALYVAGSNISAKGIVTKLWMWSGWNGTSFSKSKVLWTAPKGFPTFNGLAFGANGRLFAGVDVGAGGTNDHGPATKKMPYVYDILTFAADGKGGPTVYATGIRQPWQFAFTHGSSVPYVTDFGQDCVGKNPCSQNAKPPSVPDFLLHVRKGDNYGFPQCNWSKGSKCAGFTKPFQTFAPHTDNGGIAITHGTIYLGQFGFANQKPAVVTVPVKGGKAKTFLSGSPAPIIAIGIEHGFLYVGAAGQNPGQGVIYRVQL